MSQLVQKSKKYFYKSEKTGVVWLLTFVMLIVFFTSCDDLDNHVVPNVPVSFTVNLNIANELTIPGNSLYFPNDGFGGVLVYCELPGSYYAFDATCTYEVSPTCIAANDGVLATCPCCGSQFILISGAHPSKGPAAVPLKQYNVSIVNDFTLRVYN